MKITPTYTIVEGLTDAEIEQNVLDPQIPIIEGLELLQFGSFVQYQQI
jgi:hypothetical protein